MILHPGWPDLLLRLVLTVAAGALIGFNREARGHAAGLRTTVLVGLAAAVAMIQANILLDTDGKGPGFFGTMDLMRLPLGILTGVGFIGGGAILKRGASVTGVTTAATLWIVTAIGLCFGGGQVLLGVAATALAFLTLSGAKRVDRTIRRKRDGILVVACPGGGAAELVALLAPLGYRARFLKLEEDGEAGRCRMWLSVRWVQPEAAVPDLSFLDAVRRHHPVVSFTMRSVSEL